MTDVAEKARGLTVAQRDALMRNDNWTMDDLARSRPVMAQKLHALGITYVELSPLGQQVASHLRKEGGAS